MKKILPILFCIFLTIQTQAQSPGGVGTANLTAWFNPDVLPLGNATSWTTSFPTGASAITVTDASAPFAVVTNTPTGNTSNYNNTINFAGNGTGNLPAASSRALEFIGTLNLLDNRVAASQGTFFSSHYINDVNSGGQHMVDYREAVGDAIQFRWLSPTATRVSIGTSGASTNASRNIPDNGNPMIVSYYGNRSSATSLNTRNRSLAITTSSASQAGTGGRIGLVIGARKNANGTYGGSHRSFVNELIFFNTDLSLLDLLRVESYLAIKYGATLEPTSATAGGYLTSNTAIASWNPNPAYHNDVVGIARDDASGLTQKQSHSFDDLQRIYVGALSASNAANTASFTNDISYAVMGHNNLLLNETAAATAEMPSGQNLVNRIAREWAVQNTNLSDAFSMDITLNNFTNFSNLPGDLVLLVDDDGNFSNASVFKAGLTFSVSGNTVTVSGISNTQIPLNTTRYLTLATRTIPVPVVLTNFNVKAEDINVALDWSVATEDNFDFYGIERSVNAQDWKEIGQINGKGNESMYSYLDKNPKLGLNYYRLKMNDIDGQFEYSDLKSVEFTATDKIRVYPNPMINNKIRVEGPSQALLKLSIFNTMGQEINTRLLESKNISNNIVEFDFSNMTQGVYFIKAADQFFTIHK